VVLLNRAVAVAEAGFPETALPLVDELAGSLDGYRYMHSTRGELLARLGRNEAARRASLRALELTSSERDRGFCAAG
jgi:RNA polymerase sigma-70 factor (ECF subfamily)